MSSTVCQKRVYFAGNGFVRIPVVLDEGEFFYFDMHNLQKQACNFAALHESLKSVRVLKGDRNIKKFALDGKSTVPGFIIAIKGGGVKLAFYAPPGVWGGVVEVGPEDVRLEFELFERFSEAGKEGENTIIFKGEKDIPYLAFKGKAGEVKGKFISISPADGKIYIAFGKTKESLKDTLRKLENFTLKDVLSWYEKWDAELLHIDCSYPLVKDGYRSVINTLHSVIRHDGELPASPLWGYDGTWIRDSMMCIIPLLLAGDLEVGRSAIEYAIKNIPPKGGQLEEPGMLIYAFWLYWCMTKDNSFAAEHFDTLQGIIENTLSPQYFDENVLLCHSPVEGYWERNWLGEGYSLSQNTWIWVGLNCLADIASALGRSQDAVILIRKAADIRRGILTGPYRFIEEGRFIKRRRMDGTWQHFGPTKPGISAWREYRKTSVPDYYKDFGKAEAPLEPDVQQLVPILWGLVEPAEELSRKTIESILMLWNYKWDFGGFSRYNVLSDPDMETSGPWYLASFMAARALALIGEYEWVKKTMEWAVGEGGEGFVWSERISHTHRRDEIDRYFHFVLAWPWGEWLMLILREIAGLYYTPYGIKLKPHIPEFMDKLRLNGVICGDVRYDIVYEGWGNQIKRITLDGREHLSPILPADRGGEVIIELSP